MLTGEMLPPTMGGGGASSPARLLLPAADSEATHADDEDDDREAVLIRLPRHSEAPPVRAKGSVVIVGRRRRESVWCGGELMLGVPPRRSEHYLS